MPLAINAMQWWLSPRPEAGLAIRLGGPALLVSLYSLAIVFFYFFTGWAQLGRIASV